MLIRTFGCAVYGIEAIPITVETHIGRGINFYMVGLPDSAVKESHQRIKSAFTNANYFIYCLHTNNIQSFDNSYLIFILIRQNKSFQSKLFCFHSNR